MTQLNPFCKGYTNFSIELMVGICDEDINEFYRLPIHELHKDIDSSEIIGESALYCDDYVLLDKDDNPKKLVAKCNLGFIVDYAYRIRANHQSNLAHYVYLGNHDSKEQAHSFIENITFNTGAYSRCYEISNVHLSVETLEALQQKLMVDLMLPQADDENLFQIFSFHYPYGNVGQFCIGVKLIATPWNDKHLLQEINMTAQELYNQQVDAEIPMDFLNLIQLAGEADVRVLIFDPSAPKLEGLPIFEHP